MCVRGFSSNFSKGGSFFEGAKVSEFANHKTGGIFIFSTIYRPPNCLSFVVFHHHVIDESDLANPDGGAGYHKIVVFENGDRSKRTAINDFKVLRHHARHSEFLH